MLILVTGGSRSGKSDFALKTARRFEGPRLFLATAQASDEEMRRRIDAHRKSRPADWSVVEESREVPRALRAALGPGSAGVVIVDCKGSGLGGMARRLAARHSLPFTVIDPRDPATIGYQPCTGDASAIANN